MKIRNKQYIGFKTILVKEYFRIMRIWMQTIIPPVITITLYFIIFGTLIGSQIKQISGFSYIQFIIPGLIMMSVITNSYSNVVSSFFQAKMFKNIEEMLISPISENTIIWGYVSGGIIRGLIIGFLVTLISMFFSKLIIFNIFIIISTIILSSILFSLAGLLNGIFAKNFEDINIIPTFIITPLTYLGGVFYSIHQLPIFWQTLSRINPILYIVNLFRYGFLGLSDVNLFISFIMIIVFILILYLACLNLLKKGIGIKN